MLMTVRIYVNIFHVYLIMLGLFSFGLCVKDKHNILVYCAILYCING